MARVYRKSVTLLCANCGKIFARHQAWLNGKTHSARLRYCSNACRTAARKGQVSYRRGIFKLCVTCKRPFYVPQFRAYSAMACSRICQRTEIARNNSGPNHSRWKGGISERDQRARNWRNAVLIRDGRCTKCGAADNLYAHHLLSWGDHPQLRYDIANGVTLCGICHAKEHPDLAEDFTRKISKRRILQCAICGREFVGRTKKSRFCSVECRQVSKRNPTLTISCGVCGKTILTRRPRQRFCSTGCAGQYGRKVKNGRAVDFRGDKKSRFAYRPVKAGRQDGLSDDCQPAQERQRHDKEADRPGQDAQEVAEEEGSDLTSAVLA